MKKQLTEAADHHHQCVTELDKRDKFEVSGIATSTANFLPFDK